MTVTVSEDDGRCQAVIADGGVGVWCCAAGHANAEEAARHAWRLTTAMARQAARTA